MAARRLKTRLACAKEPPARCTSPIFAIPTATSWSGFIACRRPELPQITTKESRPFRAALCTSAVLEPVAEPNHAALQHLGARQGHRADRRRDAGILVTGIEDARRALCSIDGGADRNADLVDQAGPQKGPVRAAAAFEQQAFDPQLAVQDLQRQPQIELVLAGEDVGD